MNSGANVRAAAARQLAGVVQDGKSLAALYQAWGGEPSRDLALQRALVTGALRWHHRLQWQLGQLLSKPLQRKDAELGALMRIGLLQLQEMRVPDHAAVAATVAATAVIHRKHARGLVNAVLRRFLRERSLLDAQMVEVPEAYWSHPAWFLSIVQSEYPDSASDILAANNEQAPMWLRVNTQRVSVDEYSAELQRAGFTHTRDAELASALLLDAAVTTAELPGFAAGRVSLQDRAAQLAAQYLDLKPGQRVLDACAAPGGKTAHILELCPNLEHLVALDSDPERLTTLGGHLQRLGLQADLQRGDAAATADWWDGQAFDRILLDAPCSATGVIRRHPDIKLRRTLQDVQRCVGLQASILKALWPLLAPGGRCVYATCSVLRCENQSQIDHFLQTVPAAVCVEARQYLPGEANGDGFYYACRIKPG